MNHTLMKYFVVLSLCFVGVSVSGDPIPTVTIDEHGKGTWVYNGGSHDFIGTFVDDPSDGVGGSALVYDTTSLGLTFFAFGDYKIFKPDTDEVVGVVRFYDSHTIIFYDNDIGPGGESLADGSGDFPHADMFTVIPRDQILLGGGITGVEIIPATDMPGFTDGNLQYTFLTSLPVPEPGVFALLACGAALLGLRRKKPVVG